MAKKSVFNEDDLEVSLSVKQSGTHHDVLGKHQLGG